MRERLADLLKEYAVKDDRVHVLSGDHGYALFDVLRKAVPRQFINVGVSEQCMVGLAAGLSKSGERPIVYGLASFVPMRVLEFIKMDVCYEALPVVFLGDGAGLVYSTLGSSHQCGEDMAVLAPLPNMTIYSPADAAELEYCFRAAMADRTGASYLRIGKSDSPPVHRDVSSLVVTHGCVRVAQSGTKGTIFATGSMVSTAVALAREFPVTVVSVPVPSQIDGTAIERYTTEAETVITLEEHSLFGGLGSLVDRIWSERPRKAVMKHLGLQRHFTEVASTYEVALSEHGLTLSQLRASLQGIL